MSQREERISIDGTRVVYAPERSIDPRSMPWVVIWVEPGNHRHWPLQQLSAQAVGTWSTLRSTNEREEVIPI
jgi:hypothetical protein